MCKEVVVVYLKNYPGFCLEVLQKSVENFRYDIIKFLQEPLKKNFLMGQLVSLVRSEIKDLPIAEVKYPCVLFKTNVL